MAKRIYRVKIEYSYGGRERHIKKICFSMTAARQVKNYYTRHHQTTDARIQSAKLKWRDV